MLVYIVAEYSNQDGQRIRGVYDEDQLPDAKAKASALWTDQMLAFGVIADFVVYAWRVGQFEANSRGEREHVIFSANREYDKRMEIVGAKWTPPTQAQL